MEPDNTTEALASAAGLTATFRQFPEDVEIALTDARRFAAGLSVDLEPGDAPWPPMQAGGDQ